MQLHGIRGGNRESLEAKRYNIGVGISLGNKWFSTENIIGLIEWSLQYTREYVIVYVADSIHAINLEVRNGFSADKANRKALELGDRVLTEVNTAVANKFSSLDQGRIIYATWSDVGGDDYRSYVDYFYKKFNDDGKFAEAVRLIVRGWVSKEDRSFSEVQINRLCHYVLEELPECLKQVPIKGLSCEAWTYPYSVELLEFIDDLQQGKIFPEVSTEIVKCAPKVFLEVR